MLGKVKLREFDRMLSGKINIVQFEIPNIECTFLSKYKTNKTEMAALHTRTHTRNVHLTFETWIIIELEWVLALHELKNSLFRFPFIRLFYGHFIVEVGVFMLFASTYSGGGSLPYSYL